LLETKTIFTNKAKINLLKNNTVEKIFFNENNTEKEFENMNKLNEIFNEKEIEGWAYKTVKPIKCEENKLVMERVKGETYFDLSDKNTQFSFVIGVWFGLFHNDCRVYRNGNIRKIDFNRTNILIDEQKKEVTVIDPGALFNQRCSLEFSLINAIMGLVIGDFKKRKNPKDTIKYFLDGYFSILDEEINKNNLEHSFKKVFKNRMSAQLYKKKNKVVSYLKLKFIEAYTRIKILKLLK